MSRHLLYVQGMKYQLCLFNFWVVNFIVTIKRNVFCLLFAGEQIERSPIATYLSPRFTIPGLTSSYRSHTIGYPKIKHLQRGWAEMQRIPRVVTTSKHVQ